MKDKIKKIILNKNYVTIDKLIEIYKIVSPGKDMNKLSKVLDIPEYVLSNHEIVEQPKEPKKKEKSLYSLYIDAFYQLHKEIHGRNFDFDLKECKQTKNCMKAFKDLKTWDHVLTMIKFANKRINRGKTTKPTWKFIISQLKPSIIYNQRNFILNEESRVDKEVGRNHKLKTEFKW